MGHSAPVWDCRAATEITKDWNGIDQVVLRNPKGASARVSSLLRQSVPLPISIFFQSTVSIPFCPFRVRICRVLGVG